MKRSVDPMRRSLPYDEWPEIDRRAWNEAVAEGDLLDGRGPVAHWAKRTKETNIQHYGRWLGYLLWNDQLTSGERPPDLVRPETVQAYIAHLRAIVAPRTVLSMLVGLKEVIRAMAPEENWRWLQDACNRIQVTAKPRTDKRSKIRPTPEIFAVATAELEALPMGSLSMAEALLYRDALMLALLAARPLRVRNIASLELDRHLVKTDEAWLITIPAEETKTKQPLTFFVPDLLQPWLERYLEEVRPLFPNPDASTLLWLGKDGPPTNQRFVYQRITKLTERFFGTAINPHLLRDCAASSLASVSPDMARAAAPLLGHRHFSTTERYYIQANHLEASRKVNAILDQLKASLENIK